MYLYANVSRLAFYALLGFEAWIGEIPWWILGAWILWDNSVNLLVKVPFTKPKVPLLPQIDPTIHYPYYYGRQDGGIGGGGVGAE